MYAGFSYGQTLILFWYFGHYARARQWDWRKSVVLRARQNLGYDSRPERLRRRPVGRDAGGFRRERGKSVNG
ncbi:MAG: hypothetical protein FJX37_07970 [Alphaproteobacteria bacterium]|nr:hypothetical protein [Alphaproteobacteria bacterium]